MALEKCDSFSIKDTGTRIICSGNHCIIITISQSFYYMIHFVIETYGLKRWYRDLEKKVVMSIFIGGTIKKSAVC